MTLSVIYVQARPWPENRTGKSRFVPLPFPLLTVHFLICGIKTETDGNGTLKTGYEIGNGLAIFHPFRQDPVLIRCFPVFKSGNIPFSIQAHSVKAAQ
jgi:hypothetical protein